VEARILKPQDLLLCLIVVIIYIDYFKVECCVRQELRFNTSIQYINRLRHR